MASLTGREEGATSVIDFMKSPPRVVPLICSPKVLHKPLSGK